MHLAFSHGQLGIDIWVIQFSRFGPFGFQEIWVLQHDNRTHLYPNKWPNTYKPRILIRPIWVPTKTKLLKTHQSAHLLNMRAAKLGRLPACLLDLSLTTRKALFPDRSPRTGLSAPVSGADNRWRATNCSSAMKAPQEYHGASTREREDHPSVVWELGCLWSTHYRQQVTTDGQPPMPISGTSTTIERHRHHPLALSARQLTGISDGPSMVILCSRSTRMGHSLLTST